MNAMNVIFYSLKGFANTLFQHNFPLMAKYDVILCIEHFLQPIVLLLFYFIFITFF